MLKLGYVIICFVFCFGKQHLNFCVVLLDQFWINFCVFKKKTRERMSVYCGGGGGEGGGGGPITMFLLLVECLNFVSVSK